jgi:hypothetical protein
MAKKANVSKPLSVTPEQSCENYKESREIFTNYKKAHKFKILVQQALVSRQEDDIRQQWHSNKLTLEA